MNILDPKFKYVSSAKTDIKKTFARIRREQAETKKQADAIVAKRVIGSKK